MADRLGRWRYSLCLGLVCALSIGASPAIADNGADPLKPWTAPDVTDLPTPVQAGVSLCHDTSGSMPVHPIEPQFTVYKAVQGSDNQIAWSPDQKYVATINSWAKTVSVWSFPSVTLLYQIHLKSIFSSAIAFTADSRFLLTPFTGAFDGVNRGTFSVFDAATGAHVTDVDGPYDPTHYPLANSPNQIVVAPKSGVIYITYRPRPSNIYIFDPKNYKIVYSFYSRAETIALVPDSDDLIVLQAKNLSDGVNINTPMEAQFGFYGWDFYQKKFKYSLGFSDIPDVGHAYLVENPRSCIWGMAGIGHDKYQFVIFNENTHRVINKYTVGTLYDEGMSNYPSVSPDGNFFVFLSQDKKLYYFVVGDPRPYILASSTYGVFDAKFSPDGRFLMIADGQKLIVYSVSESK